MIKVFINLSLIFALSYWEFELNKKLRKAWCPQFLNC